MRRGSGSIRIWPDGLEVDTCDIDRFGLVHVAGSPQGVPSVRSKVARLATLAVRRSMTSGFHGRERGGESIRLLESADITPTSDPT